MSVALARFASTFEEFKGERLSAPASVMRSAKGRGVVAVQRYSDVTAFVLGTDLVGDLVEKATEHDQFIADFLACRPYLKVAIEAGVNPVAALEELLDVQETGHLAVRWQGLAALMSRTPVRMVRGEDGTALVRGRLHADGPSFGGADEDDYSAFED